MSDKLRLCIIFWIAFVWILGGSYESSLSEWLSFVNTIFFGYILYATK